MVVVSRMRGKPPVGDHCAIRSLRSLAGAARAVAMLRVASSTWTPRLVVVARQCPTSRPATWRLSQFMTACEACGCRSSCRRES